MLEQAAKPESLEEATSLAKITASGLMIAGPPHIPGLRQKCIQDGFAKALSGPNLRALAAAVSRPIHALDAADTAKLLDGVAQAALPFKATWIRALKQLNSGSE